MFNCMRLLYKICYAEIANVAELEMLLLLLLSVDFLQFRRTAYAEMGRREG